MIFIKPEKDLPGRLREEYMWIRASLASVKRSLSAAAGDHTISSMTMASMRSLQRCLAISGRPRVGRNSAIARRSSSGENAGSIRDRLIGVSCWVVL